MKKINAYKKNSTTPRHTLKWQEIKGKGKKSYYTSIIFQFLRKREIPPIEEQR